MVAFVNTDWCCVDFRKQVNGLAAIVEQELGHNLFKGGLYAFTNRQRNRVKCLFWEDDGFVLYYRALAEVYVVVNPVCAVVFCKRQSYEAERREVDPSYHRQLQTKRALNLPSVI